MAEKYTTLVGAPPVATSKNWFSWYRELLNARIAYCNIPRQTTYYVSNSVGSDSNAGTILAPFKTLAKVQTVHDAGSGDVAFLFKRGDEWDTTTGLLITKVRVTLGTYGVGEKPLFSAFTRKYNCSGWTLDSGNRYLRTEASDISWVRNQANRLEAYTRVSTTALVASTPLSFYYNGTTLYVNAGVGINPNNLNLEGCVSNSGDGVKMTGDGNYAENIRADGYGCHRTIIVTQGHGFLAGPSGTNAVTFKGCESYFCASHSMAHLLSGTGNSGGFSTFIDCKSGYTKYAGAGETIFNTFSNDGGQETIFHNCECTFGTLPSDDWTTGTENIRGLAVYGHASSESFDQSLVINYGTTVKANKWGALPSGPFACLPETPTIEDVRAFIVNEVIEENNGGGFSFEIAPQKMVRMNCTAFLIPQGYGSGALTVGQQNGWSINNFVQVDLTRVNDFFYALYNVGTNITPRIWNCHIHWKNIPATHVTGFDYDCITNVTTYSGNGELKNCIISSDGSSISYVGFNNTSGPTNNAYWNITQASGLIYGYNLHTNQVALSAFPVPIRAAYFNSQLYHTGADIGLGFDKILTPRSSTVPSIGPTDELQYLEGINFHTDASKPVNEKSSGLSVLYADQFVSGGTSFTFKDSDGIVRVPKLVCVDGNPPMPKNSSDGTENWTGDAPIVLKIAATYNIYALG